MSEASHQLGPYVLDKQVGQTDDGSVWRGLHSARNLPVAVKFIAPATHRPIWHRAHFASVARRVAPLRHPLIARVLDLGTLPKDHPMGSHHQWQVTEWIPGQSSSETLPREWKTLEPLMRQLLQALAYAHAREVVHGNLKPTNLLLEMDPEAGVRLRVRDFGLRRCFWSEAEAEGCVDFLAPEQIAPQTIAMGPWTDLYACGCLFWSWVTGNAPFLAPTAREVVQAQMSREPGTFQPQIAVPSQLEHWLRRLLVKDPASRYQRAADALYGLDGLSAGMRERSLQDQPDTTFVLDTTSQDARSGDGVAPGSPLTVTRPQLPPEPPPPDRMASAVPEPRLAWAHQPRLVGREDQLRKLWRVLQIAIAEGRPTGVVLTGPSGVGTTRLARWMSAAAHEAGAARTVWVDCGLERSLLQQAWHQLVAPGPGLLERLNSLVPRLDDTTTRLLASWIEGEPIRGWQALALRGLEHLASQRPVLLVLDDGLACVDETEWFDTMIRRMEAPVICLFTGTADTEEVEQRVTSMCSRSRVTHVPLEGLRDAQMDAVVQDFMQVDSGVREALVARSRGRPGYLVQLAIGWAEQGLLEADAERYRLMGSTHPPLPDGMAWAWRVRVQAACAGLDLPLVTALRVMASLGRSGGVSLWQEICEGLGSKRPQRASQRLVDRGLLELTHFGQGQEFRFASRHVRSLFSRENEQTEAIEIACAEAIERRDGDLVQRGFHLKRAGQLEDAATLLLEGVRSGIHSGASFRVLEVLNHIRTCLEGIGAAESDDRFAWSTLIHAQQLVDVGQFDQARRVLKDLGASPQQEGWEQVRLEAQVLQAVIAEREHRLDDVIPEMQALCKQEVPTRLERQVHRVLAAAMTEARRYEEAGQHAEALVASVGMEQALWRGYGYWAKAQLALREGDDELAAVRLKQAAARLVDAREISELPRIWNAQGDLSRRAQEWRRAERWYRRALSMERFLYSQFAAVIEMNLALLLLNRGRYKEARARFERCAMDFDKAGMARYAGFARLAVALSAAHVGKWSVTRNLVGVATFVVKQSGWVDPDLARNAEELGDLAHEHGEPQVAHRAYQLALEQHRALGNEARAARVEQLLAGASPRPKGR